MKPITSEPIQESKPLIIPSISVGSAPTIALTIYGIASIIPLNKVMAASTIKPTDVENTSQIEVIKVGSIATSISIIVGSA